MSLKIKVQNGKGGWRWAFVARNGKQTANNETHPSAANAKRAAKAVVMSVLRKYQFQPRLVWTEKVAKDGTITLYYCRDFTQEAV